MNDRRDFNSSFSLSIGDLGIMIEVEPDELLVRLQARYRDFLKPTDTNLAIRISVMNFHHVNSYDQPEMIISAHQVEFQAPDLEGLIDFATGIGDLKVYSRSPLSTIDYALRNISTILVIRDNGFVFHGAGIIHQGAGCLFFGPSGSGKTTIAKNSLNDVVLNDDLLILKKENSRWIMQATPFTTQASKFRHVQEARLMRCSDWCKPKKCL
jgi:hypothetical protein